MQTCKMLTTAVILSAMIITGSALAGETAGIQWARANWKAGRFEDAAKGLRKVLEGEDRDARTGARRFLARVYQLTGKYDEAVELFAGLEKPAVEDLVLVGRSHLARGRYKEAEEAFTRAFRDSRTQSVEARIELIDLWTMTGRIDEAELARNWFFSNFQKISKIRYGRPDPDSGKVEEVSNPAELVALARAMAPRDPQGAINALTCAQQNDKDKIDPEPYLASYSLFMEKFAWGYAPRELKAANRIAPRHPRVQLANASLSWGRQKDAEKAEKELRQALEVNPNLVPARVMLADLHLFDDEHQKARKELEAALKVNPRDLEALSLLAAYYYDLADKDNFEATCRKVLALNEHYDDLYNTIAGSCERKRQFPQASRFYQKAIALAPNNWRGYYGAGMAMVRRGEDAEGKKMLEKAFKLNKYNLFCRNMLVVLDKLIPPGGGESQFDSVSTEHFVIYAPRKDAPFLLPYYAIAMEEAYGRLHRKYGFAPENPTIIEIFSRHKEFSARTTGLPQIGADGACFGKLITLDSPRVWQNGTVSKFNWSTVAEHELMHVFSLQITDYRIPRWLTEGLSVYEELVPRIELDSLFATSARNNGLIKVQELNRQMTRPTSRMNPLLAYYQARRVVEYIYDHHGMEGMTKLLGECRQGRKIEKAIPAAFNCSMDDFESRVLKHQVDFATNVVRAAGAADKATLARLNLAVKEKPEDPEILADLAAACLQGARPDFERAAMYAGKATARAQKGRGVSRAYAVLGLIAFRRDKKYRRAREFFEKSVAADDGNSAAHLYLGICAGKEGRSEQAIKHLLKSRQLAPRRVSQPNAYEELYKVYRDIGDDRKAFEVMRERVAVDKLDTEKAIRLGKLALGAGDWKLAAWSAFQAIKVNPFDAEPHLIWAGAGKGMKDFAVAEREYRLAAMADVTSVDARVGLARALLAQGRKADALAAANEARALEPDRPDLPGLINEIEKSEEKAAPRKVDDKDLEGVQKKVQDLFRKKPAAGEQDMPEDSGEDRGQEQPVRELEKIDACAGEGRRVA